ncbi:pantoate--beta-alanine ligase [Herbiconiux moechotypicola]|uniref:Pantothenate synthetase n=1 Tax=Herbiconiux moechotypicola TaxID=637393 RepID=A0ABN3E433_9MICO|nr:pantoate--beta-alanine ligase [Herbiconiux moechotypicola]MCS5731610.1 pantoate--beta-alanine ligase [Herbiconiux moechotypicola]
MAEASDALAPHAPVVVTTVAELRREIESATARVGRAGGDAAGDRSGVALVPTMGALHAGHLALVERAAELAEVVVVSIFVNPLQFTDPADLERYPRDLDADVRILTGRGADIVFAPEVGELYPHGDIATRITAGRVGGMFEGRSRPGHFDGVLTVVAKLLNAVGPQVVLFGEKDAQQVFLVTRMVAELNMPVRVEVVETVRDSDELALSSRNRFLDARERRAAVTLPHVLEAAESAADRGIDAVLAAAQSAAMGEQLVDLDYLAVVHPDTFLPVDDDYRGRARVVIAAKVGDTRLIDTTAIYLG